MKKNDWILLVTVALYSFLFYGQTAGINFLIFTISLIAGLLLRDNQLIKNHYWKLAAVGSLLSGGCVAYYGNTLAVIANVISLSMLSALSHRANTSVVLSLVFAAYSYSSSAVFMILDWSKRKAAKLNTNPESSGRKWLLILIPLLITLVFFFMYRASNPLFNDFTKNINFDFISFSWITFTLGGLLLTYGFFYHQKIKSLDELDEMASNNILPSTETKPFNLFGKLLTISDEEFSGRLLFLCLNLLLLLVNALDANFMFINKSLPQGVTHSQFVHQGTGMLITSIVIAIAIILFYFRGPLNFSEKSRAIKLLAYIWIAQNAFILLSTVFRNNMYVMEYGLTYKRIGVYIYLLLTLIGLGTTFIKIIKTKSNAYLFRVNGWLFYGVLVITAFVNWDSLITDYNFHKAKQVEQDYLVSLSYVALPALYTYQHDTLNVSSKNEKTQTRNRDELYFFESCKAGDVEAKRDEQLYIFLLGKKGKSWRSWNYNSEKIYKELLVLNKEQKIQNLTLAGAGITSLSLFREFGNITGLNLKDNQLKQLKDLVFFKQLEKLDVRSNGLTNLDGIGALTELEYLNIGGNSITDYTPIYALKKLKKLYAGEQITDMQYERLHKNLPNTEIIRKYKG